MEGQGREGASRASSSHETKAQAVERAKELAKNQELRQVVIHKQDGTIKPSTHMERTHIRRRDKDLEQETMEVSAE